MKENNKEKDPQKAFKDKMYYYLNNKSIQYNPTTTKSTEVKNMINNYRNSVRDELNNNMKG